MLLNKKLNSLVFISVYFILVTQLLIAQKQNLKINEVEYYDIPSLNIMMFSDFYPEGHQGGLSIVQFGNRIVSNGDLRLEPTPGQWSPVPKVGKRNVDRENGIITVELWYPDSSKNKKGFNPVDYPNLDFKYIVRSEAVGDKIKITVDLDKLLPKEWEDKIGFNLEIFPGHYFGEHYLVDGKSGIFPTQANGPFLKDQEGKLQISKMAEGKELVLAPGIKEKQLVIKSNGNKIDLLDGRGLHNNGWFIVRSKVTAGKTKNAVEWILTPSYDISWRYKPVIQVSQIGYHPKQPKFGVIELDKLTESFSYIELHKISADKDEIILSKTNPELWGRFLRYKYLRFDFTTIEEEGIYYLKYGDVISNRFEIKKDIYKNYVWQPTLEYYLPVQMCHMKVDEKYRVWHGLCHMDDALMAPVNHNHFDGYIQGESTLTNFNSGEHVPGLNIGGWHDAGDYDLRVESQGGTIYRLALMYELFKNNIDQTMIDQDQRLVKIHEPDGKPDILQQIEHGVLSIVGAYNSMGRLYRGIICPSLEQYVLLGDGSTMTDNLPFEENLNDPILNLPLPKDDRWVFTENNPRRELQAAQNLAAASRVLKDYNPELSQQCIIIAKKLYLNNLDAEPVVKINTAAELYISTGDESYAETLYDNLETVKKNLVRSGFTIGRFVEKSKNADFNEAVKEAVKIEFEKVIEEEKKNPYGVPYEPYIWGAGWGIQAFGMNMLFMHLGFPEIVNLDYTLNSLNFVLGCHPGDNTSSFVSGVGSNSVTVAYGVNRADWSFIPGGSVSGTALIRPDLPELKVWPFFWQQTEYVMGGGATNFMFLAMAADQLLNKGR